MKWYRGLLAALCALSLMVIGCHGGDRDDDEMFETTSGDEKPLGDDDGIVDDDEGLVDDQTFGDEGVVPDQTFDDDEGLVPDDTL